jgi:hypothetical protein
MVSLKDWCDIASVLTGGASATFWVISTMARTKAPAGMEDGMYHGMLISSGNNVVPTLKKQAFWNALAAYFTAATVLCQCLSTVFGSKFFT